MSSSSGLTTFSTRTIGSYPLHYKMLNYIYKKQAIHKIYFCDIWSEFLMNTNLNVTETESLTSKMLRHIFYNDILKNIYLYSDIRVPYYKFRYFQFIYSAEIADLIASQLRLDIIASDTTTTSAEETDISGGNTIQRAAINNDVFDITTTITRETISEFKQRFNEMFIDPPTTNNPTTDRNNLRVRVTNTEEYTLSIIQHAIFSTSFEYGSVASKLETCPTIAFASYYLSNELERQQFIYHPIDEIHKRIIEKRQRFLEFGETFLLNENGQSIAEYLLNTINVHLIDDADTTCDILPSKHFRKLLPSNTYDPLSYSEYYKSIVKERLIAIRLNKGVDVAPKIMKNFTKISNIRTRTTATAGKKIKKNILQFSRNKRRIKYSSKSFLQRTSHSLRQTEIVGVGGGGTTYNVNIESKTIPFLPPTSVSSTSPTVSEISYTNLRSRLNILRENTDIITEENTTEV